MSDMKYLVGNEHPIVSIGIVDNDKLSAIALEELLVASCESLKILWETTSGLSAIQLCSKHTQCPEVILTDIEMPEFNGIDLAKYIYCHFPSTKVIGLTAFKPAKYTKDYSHLEIFEKDTSTRSLIQAIGRAAGSRMLSNWAGSKEEVCILTPREIEIMKLYARGRKNLAIAHQLNVSESTVKTHVKRMFFKLGVHSRSEALLKCFRDGLL